MDNGSLAGAPTATRSPATTPQPVVFDGGDLVLVYMRGVQGPIYQSRDGLTDGAAGEFGISLVLQNRVNDALQYAKNNLEVPEELGDQKRAKRTLHELEVMMEDGQGA